MSDKFIGSTTKKKEDYYNPSHRAFKLISSIKEIIQGVKPKGLPIKMPGVQFPGSTKGRLVIKEQSIGFL